MGGDAAGGMATRVGPVSSEPNLDARAPNLMRGREETRNRNARAFLPGFTLVVASGDRSFLSIAHFISVPRDERFS